MGIRMWMETNTFPKPRWHWKSSVTIANPSTPHHKIEARGGMASLRQEQCLAMVC